MGSEPMRSGGLPNLRGSFWPSIQSLQHPTGVAPTESFAPFAGSDIWLRRPEVRTSRFRDNGHDNADGIGSGSIGRCDHGRPWTLAVAPAMRNRKMIHGVAEFLDAYERF